MDENTAAVIIFGLVMIGMVAIVGLSLYFDHLKDSDRRK